VHTQELHVLLSLTNLIRVINLKIRWARHVACTGNKTKGDGEDA
jgi:hypothetical protein